MVEHANILNSGKEESTAAIRTFMAAVEQPLEGKKNFKKIITEQRLLQFILNVNVSNGRLSEYNTL